MRQASPRKVGRTTLRQTSAHAHVHLHACVPRLGFTSAFASRMQGVWKDSCVWGCVSSEAIAHYVWCAALHAIDVSIDASDPSDALARFCRGGGPPDLRSDATQAMRRAIRSLACHSMRATRREYGRQPPAASGECGIACIGSARSGKEPRSARTAVDEQVEARFFPWLCAGPLRSGSPKGRRARDGRTHTRAHPGGTEEGDRRPARTNRRDRESTG